jgi:hypothetical protein
MPAAKPNPVKASADLFIITASKRGIIPQPEQAGKAQGEKENQKKSATCL